MELHSMEMPSKWVLKDSTPRGRLIELTFAVKQRGLQELHDTLMKVSSPTSSEYGKHLSNEQVQALTAPEPSHIQAVQSFLAQHNVEVSMTTPNKDMIFAKVPVEIAESMLSAQYVQVAHSA